MLLGLELGLGPELVLEVVLEFTIEEELGSEEVSELLLVELEAEEAGESLLGLLACC